MIALVAALLAWRVLLPLAGPPGTSAAATPTPTPTVTRTGTPTPTVTVSPTASPSPSATPLVASATPVVAEVVQVPPPPPATSTPSATATPTATLTVMATPAPKLFVLAGQSNMLPPGRVLERPVTPEDAGVVLGALYWTVQPGASPGTIRVPGGPGLAFARAVVGGGVSPIGLVGCAVGGSSIRQWQRGTPLYTDCLAAVQATGLPVAGLLFSQGEVDARSDGYQPPDGTTLEPDRWAELFKAFVTGFRADTGQPDLPVILGRLAQTTSTVHGRWATVQAQQDLAAATVAGVTLVDPGPVELADGMHWSDASYGDQGRRMATAYLSHRPPP